MKKLLALWIATLVILCIGVGHYANIASRLTGETDPQSLARYNQANDMLTTYLAVLAAVFVVGLPWLILGFWRQFYPSTHPRRSTLKSATYWNKVSWVWWTTYFVALVGSCVAIYQYGPRGVLGFVPTVYLFRRANTSMELSDELRHRAAAPRAYDPRRHPI